MTSNWYTPLDTMTRAQVMEILTDMEMESQCYFRDQLNGCSIDVGYGRSATFHIKDAELTCDSFLELVKKDRADYIADNDCMRLNTAKQLFDAADKIEEGNAAHLTYHLAEQIIEDVIGNTFRLMQQQILDLDDDDIIKDFCEGNDIYLLEDN